MIKRIINKIKRILYHYKEFNDLKKYIGGKKGIYQFSSIDLRLYRIEKKQIMKHKESEVIDDNLVKITIGSHEIFWPNNVSDADLPWLYHEIFDTYESNPSSYDHPEMKYEEAKWIIDAGCCEGYFSLFVFNKNKAAKVIAFEPLKEMEAAIKKTFENKIQEKRFILEQKAIGAVDGVTQFKFDSTHLCDSSSIKELNQNGENNSYVVKVASLDSISEAYELNEDGIIKMDIEGAEVDALLGGAEIMKRFKPKLAVAVYHDYENAIKCREIILKANPTYKVEFRGMYGYFSPPRPYILFAW
jgi:FkbM family methyltransferase